MALAITISFHKAGLSKTNSRLNIVSVIEKINRSGWADWSFSDFHIDYENVSIKLTYFSDSIERPDISATIICHNFIGFSFIGHWDENIIEDINIAPMGDLITNSLQEIKHLNGDPPIPSLGGGIKKVDNQYYQLNIKMIDGNVIKVACESFEFKM